MRINIRNKNVLVAVFFLILCVAFFCSFIFTFISIDIYTMHTDYNVADFWIKNKRIMNIILILIVPVLSTGYALSQLCLNIWLLCRKSRNKLLFFAWTTIISTIVSFGLILISQIYHDLGMDSSEFSSAFKKVQELKGKYYISVTFNLILFIAIAVLSSLCLVAKSVFIRVKPASLVNKTTPEASKQNNAVTNSNFKSNNDKNDIRARIYQAYSLLNSDAKVVNYPTSSSEMVELDYNIVKILNSYLKTHPSEIQEELIKMYKEIYPTKNYFKLDILMNIIYKQAIKIKLIHKYLKDAIIKKMQEKFVPEAQLQQFKTNMVPAVEAKFKEDEEKFISIIKGWIMKIDERLNSFMFILYSCKNYCCN